MLHTLGYRDCVFIVLSCMVCVAMAIVYSQTRQNVQRNLLPTGER